MIPFQHLVEILVLITRKGIVPISRYFLCHSVVKILIKTRAKLIAWSQKDCIVRSTNGVSTMTKT